MYYEVLVWCHLLTNVSNRATKVVRLYHLFYLKVKVRPFKHPSLTFCFNFGHTCHSCMQTQFSSDIMCALPFAFTFQLKWFIIWFHWLVFACLKVVMLYLDILQWPKVWTKSTQWLSAWTGCYSCLTKTRIYIISVLFRKPVGPKRTVKRLDSNVIDCRKLNKNLPLVIVTYLAHLGVTNPEEVKLYSMYQTTQGNIVVCSSISPAYKKGRLFIL